MQQGAGFQNPKTNESVLIFGGNGFIGKHLSQLLLNHGYKVYVADLDLNRSQTGIEYLFCDVRKPIRLHFDVPPRIVINLAAIHRTPGHRPEEYYETNVLGAIHVTRWCEENLVDNLVFTSSIAVYGLSGDRLTEDSALQPINHYGRSKMFAEEVYKLWLANSHGISSRKLSICRPSVIFGPGENGNFTRLVKAMKRGIFIYPAGPNIMKGCGYVKDLVSALHFSMAQSDDYFLFNFSNPSDYSIGDICDTISSLAHFRSPLKIKVPELGVRVVDLLSSKNRLFQRVRKLTVSSLIGTDKLKQAGFRWNYTLESSLRDWQIDTNFDLY